MKSLSLSIPHIIATIGLPGTGKSYFAETFATNFKAPHVDEIYFRGLAHNVDDGTDMAAEVLKQIMKTGHTLLFEGQLDTKDERDALIRFAKTHHYEVLFVWVQADPDTSKKRALKHMNASQYKARSNFFEPPTEKENYIVISGHHTHATQARTLLKRLIQPRNQQLTATAIPVRTRPGVNQRRIG